MVSSEAMLLACGVVLEVCFIGIALAGDLRPQIHLLWGLAFPAFACYALACWRALYAAEKSAATDSNHQRSRGGENGAEERSGDDAPNEGYVTFLHLTLFLN